MTRNIFSTIIFIFLGISSVKSQDQYNKSEADFEEAFIFSWDANKPMANDFIKNTSFWGWRLAYQRQIDKRLYLGADISWNSFYQYEERKTYKMDGGADITTDLYKYNYTLPMAITGHYYIPASEEIKPFIGLGLGTTYSSPSLFANIYEIPHYNWGFLVRPEIGTIVNFDENWGLHIGARYSFSTNKESSFNIKNLQALGLQIGIVYVD